MGSTNLNGKPKVWKNVGGAEQQVRDPFSYTDTSREESTTGGKDGTDGADLEARERIEERRHRRRRKKSKNRSESKRVRLGGVEVVRKGDILFFRYIVDEKYDEEF